MSTVFVTLPRGTATTAGSGRRIRVAMWAMSMLLTFVILAPLVADGQGNASGSGNLFRQGVYGVIFATALLCTQVGKRQAVLFLPPATLLMTLAWFCISITWADNPGVGARRLILTSIVIWSLFLLVDTIGYGGTIQIVRRLLPLVLFANLLAVLLVPNWAIHRAAVDGDPSIVGAWRGILMQKNFAGVVSALTVIFFMFDARHMWHLWRWGVILLAAIFLFFTNSRTSMSLLIASLLIGWLYRFYRPYYRWVWCVLLTCALPLAAILAYDCRQLLMAPFASPDAFTGRVQIWTVLLRYAGDHLLLGSGYGSFWNAGEPQALAQYTHGWVLTKITSGHNGFLDILVQTGIPGLVLSIFSGLLAPLWLFMKQDTIPYERAALILATIWFCFTQNFTESGLYDRDVTTQVFLMLAVALLCRGARRI